MKRGARVGWLALAASVLLHAALLGGLAVRLPSWELPAEAPPIEARLVERAPAVAPPAPAPPAPAPRRRPKAAPPPVPMESVPHAEAPPERIVLQEAETAEEPEPESDAADAAAEETPRAPTPLDELADQPPPAADGPPPLNPLPPRIDMRFGVHYGFASGEQTLLWVSDGERYTLVSVASATGLAGIFYRGRLVQTSQGRVTPTGLQPEEFWDQRGDRRSSARFDHAAARVTVTPARGAPRHLDDAGDVQDLLSVLFQFALTAPPDGPVRYTVFNGKKLRPYAFESRGEVMLDTALGPLRTLHFARVGELDGRFEVWLAIDRHYLPVRVLRGDDDGNVAELRVLAITP